VKSLKF